jgi:FkbM family methyltransferase
MRLQARLNLLDKLFEAVRSLRLTRALLHHRVLAGAEHRQVLVRDFATVIDIGANRGQFALAARQWAPSARVISFEPLPGPAKVFRSVFAGDNRVVLHGAAIGPQTEQRVMHVSARDDSSSLLPISGLQSKIFPGTAEVSTVEVQVGPLEMFVKAGEISAPAMLKLDVQGFEYEALCGCESLMSRIDFVYCECSFVELYSDQKLAADVIDWLAARGFRLKGMFNPAYDEQGQAIQADFLFSRATEAACES